MAIPRIIFRTVPETTPDHVEAYWQTAVDNTPGWQHITYRDPINPDAFPSSTTFWDACTSGAQRAGLIRLDAMAHHGGIYLDSDVEVYRPLEPLTQLRGFAGWEDRNVVPDAILGFEAGHPIVPVMLEEALTRLKDGAWESGPGVTTRNLPGREDVILFPPGTLYPYHYSIKRRYDPNRPDGARRRTAIPAEQPWALMAHHWHHSWKGA